MFVFLLQVLAKATTDESAVWPITISGWVTLFLSIGTLVAVVVGTIVGYSKWLTKMNGMGRRIKVVEDEQVRIKAVSDERGRQFERLLAQHESLIEAVAGAKKSAEQCSVESEQHALMIGSKVDEMKNKFGGMELSISQRLTAVETKMEILMVQQDRG